jgi:hypothetical protein
MLFPNLYWSNNVLANLWGLNPKGSAGPLRDRRESNPDGQWISCGVTNRTTPAPENIIPNLNFNEGQLRRLVRIHLETRRLCLPFCFVLKRKRLPP